MNVDQSTGTTHILEYVRLTDDYKTKYWCRRFNLSVAVLRQIILKVGEKVTDIEKHIKGVRN